MKPSEAKRSEGERRYWETYKSYGFTTAEKQRLKDEYRYRTRENIEEFGDRLIHEELVKAGLL